MLRLSIARSPRSALVVLTLVLAAVAAVGVASLYERVNATRTCCNGARSDPSAATRQARAVQLREQARTAAARAQARSDSRRALLLMGIAGLLALGGALALVSTVVRSMTRPLDDLVQATHALAHGGLERRVRPSGPRELRALGAAFNTMADDLFKARRRFDDERRRLTTIIESLGDALP